MTKPGITISQLHDAPVPAGLRAAILARVAQLERRLAAWRAFGLFVSAAFSAAFLWESVAYVAQEAYLSGFADYLELLVTDRDVVLGSWRQFATMLATSLPAIPLAVVCAALLAFVWSLARAQSNARVALHPVRFA